MTVIRRPDDQGWLILVAGPSGAGKDSVMAGAMARLGRDMRIAIARRVITRPPEPDGERNLEVSEAEFERMRRAGAFLLDWQAHGLRYAIPNTILPRLQDGETVLANVSRTRLTAGRGAHGNTATVIITASEAMRAQRLASRGREDRLDQTARVARRVDDVDVDLRIDNDGALDEAVDRLCRFIVARVAGGASVSPS